MIIARGRTSCALTCSNEVPGWTLSSRAMRHVVHGLLAHPNGSRTALKPSSFMRRTTLTMSRVIAVEP